MPAWCRHRRAGVLHRFDEWWDHATGRLIPHLDGGGWHTSWDARTLSRMLCPTQEGVMCQCPFTNLLLAVSHAWLIALAAFPHAGAGLIVFAEDVFSRRDPRPFVDWVAEAAGCGF
jgi:hypothetical protein